MDKHAQRKWEVSSSIPTRREPSTPFAEYWLFFGYSVEGTYSECTSQRGRPVFAEVATPTHRIFKMVVRSRVSVFHATGNARSLYNIFEHCINFNW